MKLIGKLQDGTIFTKKGHDDFEPLEFKADEGIYRSYKFIIYVLFCVMYVFSLLSNGHFGIHIYRASD